MPTYPSAYTVCGFSEECPTPEVEGGCGITSRRLAREAGWHAPGDTEPEPYTDRCPDHIGWESLEDYDDPAPSIVLRHRSEQGERDRG